MSRWWFVKYKCLTICMNFFTFIFYVVSLQFKQPLFFPGFTCIILCYICNIPFYARPSFILTIIGWNTIWHSTSYDILPKMIYPSFFYRHTKWYSILSFQSTPCYKTLSSIGSSSFWHNKHVIWSFGINHQHNSKLYIDFSFPFFSKHVSFSKVRKKINPRLYFLF